ncbi:hypothetical protein RvVAR031_24030 [Agrobacterium vitis]|nr:hypothetical protein RvVAR031_24030 [Agrobacterium vitis]
MGCFGAQVFAIDGDGADDFTRLHGQPDGICRIPQTIAKVGEASGDNAFEMQAEACRSRIVKRMHLRDTGNETRSIALDNVNFGCCHVAPIGKSLNIQAKPVKNPAIFVGSQSIKSI